MTIVFEVLHMVYDPEAFVCVIFWLLAPAGPQDLKHKVPPRVPFLHPKPKTLHPIAKTLRG